MIKDVIERNKGVKPNDEVLNLLHRDFADCFNNEGKFDIAKFQSLISGKVDLVKENQGFDFLGKSYARMLASMDSTTVIVPDDEHNAKPENANSKNIYISGDNLDALKHLVKSYAGQVKCIYIDPPYNTGSDGFVYNDKFKFTKEDLAVKLDIDEEQAERILGFNDGSTCSDAAWMTFMLPRLQKAKEMLTDDGVIFISIDDNEQANLKLLCDEVFGPENFLGCFIWKRRQMVDNRAITGVSVDHEYLLSYSRMDETRIAGQSTDMSKYSNPDNDPRGDWMSADMTGLATKEQRPNLHYDLVHDGINYGCPDTGWRYAPNRMQDLIDNNEIIFPPKPTGRPRRKKFAKDLKNTVAGYSTVLKTVYNTQGTREIRELFDGVEVFDFPKPVDLIKLVIRQAMGDNDLFVDFFSGSGTSAQSIMECNAEDLDGSRRYILVQLQETLGRDSAARTKGYMTIDEIGMDRIRRAAKKIKKEHPMFDGDFGFKHYTLKELPEETIDKLEEFKPLEFVGAPEMLKLMGGKESVLTTWLCDDHYGLGAELRHVKFGGYTAYYIDKHLYLIDEGFNEQAMAELMEKYERDAMDFHPATIVVFGYSFSLAEMLMLKKNIPALKDNENGTNITVDVRY